MAPTETLPAAEGGDDSFFSEIGEVLSSAAGGSEETPQETVEQPAAEEAQPAEQPAEAAQPAEQPEATAKPATDPTPEPYKLTADGNSYIVPKQDFAALSGLRQYTDAVQARFPTAQDAEVAYFDSSDFRAMRSDYVQGNDQDLDGWFSYWTGADHFNNPAVQKQYQESFARVAERMPSVLKGINEQAYNRLSENLIQGRVQAAYDKAARSGDPQDFLDAQRLDWGLTGQYKTELPKFDPAKEAQDRLAAEQKAITDRENALLDRDWQSFNKTSLDGTKWAQFNSEIDKVLAPVKDKYDPAVFKHLRDGIAKDLLTQLQKDTEWARDHGNERRAIESSYKHAWRSRQSADSLKPRIQAYVNDFMVRVRRNLPSIAAPLLNKATATQVASTTQKPTPARAQNGRFTTPPQQPAPAATTPKRWEPQEDPEFTSLWKH